MREFNDIQSFVRFLETRVVPELPLAEHRGLDNAGEIIEKEAKREIGHYQEAAGPFPAWEPLSEATLEGFWIPPHGPYVPGKEELGYSPPDNPLLRTGELRDSISRGVSENTVVVGSSDEVMVWQELGTLNARYPIPPRSVLGSAAVRKTSQAVNAAVHQIIYALAGMPIPNYRVGDE